jgi:hypothetical protein
MLSQDYSLSNLFSQYAVQKLILLLLHIKADGFFQAIWPIAKL